MSRATVCLVMDADGSHPVSKLPEMILPILAGEADITVGSRNIPGGDSDNWPWYRRLISRTAAWMTLGLSEMTDPTTGFMGIRRELLKDLELDPVGWKIVLEIVVKAAPARLMEVPIVFRDRQAGKSKMSLGVQWSYIRHLSRLYRYRLSRRGRKRGGKS
jgi:dolichol-phosphate mannosyltransferase